MCHVATSLSNQDRVYLQLVQFRNVTKRPNWSCCWTLRKINMMKLLRRQRLKLDTEKTEKRKSLETGWKIVFCNSC